MSQDSRTKAGGPIIEDISQMTEEEARQAELDDLLSGWGGLEEDVEGNDVVVGISLRKVFRDFDGDLACVEYEEIYGLLSVANCVRLEDSIQGFLEPDEELESYFNDGVANDEFDDEDDG